MKTQSMILPALLLFTSATLTAASDVCSSDDFVSLSGLVNNSQAASECSSRVPAFTVTTTMFNASTTLYTISSSTTIATVTKTVYTIANTTEAPQTAQGGQRLKPRQTTCAEDEALASLSNMQVNELATACACIGNQAATTTATRTAAAEIVIESFTRIVSSTTTETVTLPSPCFTHVWGTRNGCEDTTDTNSVQLSTDVTDKMTATAQCMDWCTQTSGCSSLYVQLLFPSYGSVTPVYRCYANGDTFNSDTDLLCNLSEKIWGDADAYVVSPAS